MGMAAPKGTAAPQAGLAALAQPAQAPKGKSPENMNQMMALARNMSDAQLAEVLQGKNVNVPQYVAMTEAMGRKQLRTAMDGLKAGQEGQQASLKDKLMGEYQQEQQAQMPEGGGIASIPAPNMAPEGMAGGGIVAFEEGGQIPRFNQGVALTEEQIDELRTTGKLRRKPEDIPENPLKGFGMSQRMRPYADAQKNAMRDAIAAAPAVTTAQAMQQDMENAAPGTALTTPPPPPFVAAPPVTVKKSGLDEIVKAQTRAEEAPKNQAGQDYLATLEGLTNKQREGLAAIRSQGGGEAMMQIAAGILSSPTLAGGLSKGLPLLAATSAASRKEQRDVEKSANEYDLNLAKAREAVESGDMDRAFKYKTAADENMYRMGMLDVSRGQLNKPDSGIAMLNALKNPENMAIYEKMKAANKVPTDIIPRPLAFKEWNDLMPNEKKKYGSFDNYYAQLTGGTIGAGTDLQAQAAAILKSRS
jgi:hypothetical protein